MRVCSEFSSGFLIICHHIAQSHFPPYLRAAHKEKGQSQTTHNEFEHIALHHCSAYTRRDDEKLHTRIHCNNNRRNVKIHHKDFFFVAVVWRDLAAVFTISDIPFKLKAAAGGKEHKKSTSRQRVVIRTCWVYMYLFYTTRGRGGKNQYFFTAAARCCLPSESIVIACRAAGVLLWRREWVIHWSFSLPLRPHDETLSLTPHNNNNFHFYELFFLCRFGVSFPVLILPFLIFPIRCN